MTLHGCELLVKIDIACEDVLKWFYLSDNKVGSRADWLGTLTCCFNTVLLQSPRMRGV